MDKIRELMEKCGLSIEAATSICEAIQSYTTTMRESLEDEYTKRTEAAKRICIEETEQHKLEISRRLQIFCEANVSRIEQHIAKQAHAREGEAIGTLEQIKAMLEGINVADDNGLKREYIALKESTTKLQKERDQAITKANRQTEIAEKVLRRNRLLESKVALSESVASGGRRQPAIDGRRQLVNDSRQNRGQPLTDRTLNPQRRRIDEQRTNGSATTTRRTLAESQDRHEPVDERGGANVRNGGNGMGGMSPGQIAASMEDGLPI